MSEKIKTTVRIFGSDYTLVGTESEEYMQKVCLYVDRLMRNLSSDSSLSTAKVSVLAAINMSDAYHKAKEELAQTAAELERYRGQSSVEKGELAGLRQENAYLKEEIQQLKIELARQTGK